MLADNFRAIPFDGRDKGCTISELPEKHGPLIDADELLDKVWDADTRVGYVQVVDRQDIEDAQPLIEAEGE